MRRLTVTVGLALLCVLTPRIGAAQNRIERAAAVFGDANYIVRIGDVLHVRIWGYPREEDVTDASYPVERDGRVHLPLVGPVQVANKTAWDVQEIVRTKFAEEQRRPVVQIAPSFAISVMGEVSTPGVVDVYPSYTVFEAITLSGGFRETANRKDVILIREGKAIEIKGGTVEETAEKLAATLLQSGDRVMIRRAKTATLPYLTMGINALISVITLAFVVTK